jgi:hypothetical protein
MDQSPKKKVTFKDQVNQEKYEAKKNETNQQLYQLAYNEASQKLSTSEKKLEKIEQKLTQLQKKKRFFGKRKMASLGNEKLYYQKKINVLRTIIRKQLRALDQKKFNQLKKDSQNQAEQAPQQISPNKERPR